ncbi:MAG: hypothetical protein H0W68_07485 [Gemmatimonadaceae bacterium]|nr:hypothetical protein [Gemmatimonadaceae bacterium]
MFDDLHSDDGGRKRERAANAKRPMADREVPLTPRGESLAATVHAWLDGEVPERETRRAEWSRDVEFWKRLDDDLAARRRMRTPVHLQARIMNAIPQHTPVLITPWWHREFVITPSSAIVVMGAMMAATAAATAMLLR